MNLTDTMRQLLSEIKKLEREKKELVERLDKQIQEYKLAYVHLLRLNTGCEDCAGTGGRILTDERTGMICSSKCETCDGTGIKDTSKF